MNNSKTNRKVNFFNHIALVGILAFCIANFILLIKIKDGLYDTFHVNDVSFIYHQDNTYTLAFRAASAQNKSYEGNTLYFYFKCYDKNGAMIDDDIQVIADGNMIGALNFYNSVDGDVSMVSSGDINYCELNYAEVYNKKLERIINSL